MKLIKLFLIGLLVFAPLGTVFANHGHHTGKIIGTSGAQANTEITATLKAPTANRFMLLSCYIIQLYSDASTPTANTILLTTLGLGTGKDLSIQVAFTNTAEVVVTEQFCFDTPVRAESRQTAITMTGNSGDSGELLRITLIGYEGL